MEVEDKKIKDIKTVTFQNHYGVMKLKKALGDCCSLRAVPRALSSSCGTCAVTEGLEVAQILEKADTDLLEGIYKNTEEGYIKIYGTDD